MDTDRNLLFGVLALQADLLDPQRFAEACAAWSGRKNTPLADLLVEWGWLSIADRAVIDHLLARRLAKFGGDAHASLLAAAGPVERSILATVGAADVRATMTPAAVPGADGPTFSFPSAVDPGYDGTRLAEDAGGLTSGPTADYEPKGASRYAARRLHAVGGIGQVWIARDGDLGRDVALKELRPHREGHPPTQARFLAEARITGQLEHPNIVPVYELVRGTPARPAFYAMRFVKGRTLTEKAKEFHDKLRHGKAGALDLRGLLADFLGVCNAVAYAHSRGVLHRDLKGANVVLGDYGEVVLLDWGLAKLVGRPDPSSAEPSVHPASQSTLDQTAVGQVVGTPAYMPPEQAAGRLDEVDVRSDVYGLGAVLYEVLTGRPPFAGADVNEVLQKVMMEAPPGPRDVVPATPRPLEAICLAALAKRPADRYATVKHLIADVNRYLADEPVSVYREPVLERFGRRLRRNRTLAAALSVAAAVLTPALAIGVAVQRENNAALVAEQGRTNAAKNLAEERLAQATDTWYTQVTDVQRELVSQDVSPRLSLQLLTTARERITDLLRDAERTPRVEHMFFVLHHRLADAHLALGETKLARDEWQRAHAIAEGQMAADPDGPQSRHDLGHSYRILANVRAAENDLTGAIDAAREAEKQFAAHAAAHPADPRLDADRLALAKDYGRMLIRAGRPAEAKSVHEVGRRIAREAAARNPDDLRARRDLQILCRRAGNDLLRSGALEDARAAYQEAQAAVEFLQGRDPQNRALVQEKAVIALALGDVEAGRDRLSAARAEYRRALEVFDRLAGRPGAPPATLFDLAVTYEKLGEVSLRENEFDRAASEFGEQARTLRRLATHRQDNQVSFVLANALARVGVAHQSAGRTADARTALTECLTLRRARADSSVGDVEAAVALAEAYGLLGHLERDDRELNFEEALGHYKAGVAILEPLSKAGRLAGRPAWAEQYQVLLQNVRYVEFVLAAVADLNLARKGTNPVARSYLLIRARVWAKQSDAAEAAATADAIARLTTDSETEAATLLDAARGYAAAARAARPPAREAYAGRAVEFLARAAGGKSEPGWRTDPDLEPLRGRADFLRLTGSKDALIPFAE